MMKTKRWNGTALGAFLALLAPQYAQAETPAPNAGEPASSNAQAASDDDGSTIIVTANRREERLQDVPIAVSALSADQIRNMRVTNVLELNNVAPGLRITSADAAANPKIFIRGVGLSDFNPSSSSGVGIYADGVYVGSPLAQLAGFYDIERIEVLRGPQGTLFGRNTTGGAINVITKRPTQTFQGNASVDYGQFNTVNANAAIGGPIVQDKLAFRLSGQYVRDDGNFYNRTTGDHIGYQNRYAIRGQLLYTPASNVEFLVQGSFFRNRGSATTVKSRALFPTSPASAGPDGLCAPGSYSTPGACTDLLGYQDTNASPYSVESNLQGKDKVDVANVSVTATIELGALDIISITAYQDAWRDDIENTDGSPLQMLEARYNTVQREFSHEIRFQSHGKTRARWVIGGYYMRDYLRDNSSYDVLRALRPLFATPQNPSGVDLANSVAQFSWPYVQKTDSFAVFGQIDYDVTDRLTITGGLRWSADEKSIDYTSAAEQGSIVLLKARNNKTFSDWSGRAGISYELSPSARIYATFNRGYKSGGFFGGQATSLAQLEPYKNERLNAYETGLKTEILGRRVRANLSAFYYDYSDQQVYSLEVRNGITTQVLTNAASSRAYGGEFELGGNPIRPLAINFSVAYLNTRILDFQSAGEDYSGNMLQHSPKWSVNGSITYTADLPNGSAIIVNADANWRSRVYFDNTQRLRISDSPKALANAQVGWRLAGGHFELGGFVKNIFNQTYLNGISSIESLGFDALTYGQQRRAGGYLRASF